MTIFKTRKKLAYLADRHYRLERQHDELNHKFYGLIRSIRMVANGTTCEEHFERQSQTSPGSWNTDIECIAALTRFAKFCKEEKISK